MDFWAKNKLPSCSEVYTWSPDDLVDYFKACNLKDCEKLVKKQGISGKTFLEMSEIDMQRFPKVRIPILIKIQQQINKKEDKKGLFPTRSDTQRPQPPGGKFNVSYPPRGYDTNTQDSDGSNSSFEGSEESDGDYETPDGEEDGERNSDDDYEPPPSNDEPIILNTSKSANSNQFYVDRISTSMKNPPNPPVRIDPHSQSSRGNTFPGSQPSSNQDDNGPRKKGRTVPGFAPHVDRTKKPTLILPPQSHSGSQGRNEAAKATTLPATIRPMTHVDAAEENGHQKMFPHPSYSSNTFPAASPKPIRSQRESRFNHSPVPDIPKIPQVPSLPRKSVGEISFEDKSNERQAMLTHRAETRLHHDLSSEQWYLGSISRKEAEVALRSINQDGTFLVRDCSQVSNSQPYVLMVLYKNKVYNVRIRYNQEIQKYLLGSGGIETFSSVSEIINYFCTTPLLLIDGKDRGSRQHCKLTYVAQRKSETFR